ncbi:MAG: glycosyltransferase [Actinomycetota bacterium]
MATAISTEPTRAPKDSKGAVPSVLAVVVTYRGRTWLRNCLTALNLQTYPYLDVLVVDDASPDWRQQPHLKRIAKRHLRRRRWAFMRTPRSLGFGGAINWALSRVRTDADLLLFIHDDAELTPDSVGHMVTRISAEEGTAVVGPKILSWDNPTRLEEVGMAIDRFGYPYKGLEEGEIDLGQHDTPAEVFFVTSTCMLVRHDVFRQLRGWDARMRAFSEDLDLCWRARLAGWVVRVEPLAQARHAIALATGQRRSRFTPTRYFIRRNRLRTLAKNFSGLRLAVTVPLFVLLTFAEMFAFLLLRQPRETFNLARALGWNLFAFPQTLSERTWVQRKRTVPDRKLRRLTVRQSARMRFYVSHQADRLEEAWGRRAELFAQRRAQARVLGARFAGRAVVIALVVVVAVLIAFRHYLWGPSASTGELWPYPDRSTALLRAFAAPWRAIGLGTTDPVPPALPILGVFPLLAFGAVGVAQKLMVLVLGAVAGIGAYFLLSDVVDRQARVVSAIAYLVGAVGYAGVRQGSLGALFFGAAAPFVGRSLIRLTGWARPPGWYWSREVAVAAIGMAVSAAFVPGSLALFAGFALVLAAARWPFGPGGMRGVLAALLAAALAWALLLPWSATWLREGGALDRLFAPASWRGYASGFSEHGMASVVLGQTPDAPALVGVAAALLGLVALIATEGVRRRLALALWAVVVATGLIVALIGEGVLRPVVASPVEAGVLPWLALAGLAGLALGGFRLDLPRRGLGLMHGLTVTGLIAGGALAVAGAGPSVWRGNWVPGGGNGPEQARARDQIASVIEADVEEAGPFRAVWVGSRWASGVQSTSFPPNDHLLTGPHGRLIGDLFYREAGAGDRGLEAAIAAVETGSTDRAGSLLSAYNIRFVVVERDESEPWLAQRDLAVTRDEPDYLVLETSSYLPRAAVFTQLPGVVAQDEPVATDAEVPVAQADQVTSYRYAAEDVSGDAVVLLTERSHPGWSADVEGTELRRLDAGWANAFTVPEALAGRMVVSFPRSLEWYLRTGAMVLAWVVILGAAFSRRRAQPKRGSP